MQGPGAHYTDLELTAYHEAGHTVAGVVLDLDIGPVTIVPQEDSLGRARVESIIRHGWLKEPWHTQMLEKDVVSLFAGGAVEAMLTGGWSRGDSGDREKVEFWMRRSLPCNRYGERAWEAYQRRLERRAGLLMAVHFDKVRVLAEALLQRKTLQEDDVYRLIGPPRRLPRSRRKTTPGRR